MPIDQYPQLITDSISVNLLSNKFIQMALARMAAITQTSVIQGASTSTAITVTWGPWTTRSLMSDGR